MERSKGVAVLQSGASAVTANGQSSGVDVSRFTEGLLLINTTAVSGTTPSLTLSVETLDPVTNTWFTHPVSISAINSVSKTVVQLTNFGHQIRLKWTVGGTNPSFTFSAVFVAKS